MSGGGLLKAMNQGKGKDNEKRRRVGPAGIKVPENSRD